MLKMGHPGKIEVNGHPNSYAKVLNKDAVFVRVFFKFSPEDIFPLVS